MGRDTVGAKPSVRYTEYRGVRISGGSIACKHMEMAFRTERSVRIVVAETNIIILMCSDNMSDQFQKWSDIVFACFIDSKNYQTLYM